STEAYGTTETPLLQENGDPGGPKSTPVGDSSSCGPRLGRFEVLHIIQCIRQESLTVLPPRSNLPGVDRHEI
ncbi:MAG TPA: hypothetical protein P5534_15930, partial [Candidatus Paceibacterota bacterium]|nr:hypothetical protein [Candidatus Paceibacterota bacterium]